MSNRSRSSESNSTALPKTHTPDSPKPQALFDLNAALDLLDNDMDLLSEMFTVFVRTYRDLLDTIRTAARNSDAGTLTNSAHRLKGSLSLFAAKELAANALELERLGKMNLLDHAGCLAEELGREVEEFVAQAHAAMEEADREK